MVGRPRGSLGQSFAAFAEQRHGEVDVCSERGEMKRPEVGRCPLRASDGRAMWREICRHTSRAESTALVGRRRGRGEITT
jgi:hypothetical protein